MDGMCRSGWALATQGWLDSQCTVVGAEIFFVTVGSLSKRKRTDANFTFGGLSSPVFDKAAGRRGGGNR